MVANTVAALTDIHNLATARADLPPDDPAIFKVTPSILTKLLVALNECSEWGRVAVLTALARYEARDDKESEHICERVAPQFQHVNPSVVLAAVKVVFTHMRSINPELVRSYLKKMAPPLGKLSHGERR